MNLISGSLQKAAQLSLRLLKSWLADVRTNELCGDVTNCCRRSDKLLKYLCFTLRYNCGSQHHVYSPKNRFSLLVNSVSLWGIVLHLHLILFFSPPCLISFSAPVNQKHYMQVNKGAWKQMYQLITKCNAVRDLESLLWKTIMCLYKPLNGCV